MSKLFLTTDQENYNRYLNQIISYGEIYTTASKELVNLDVKGYKAENLINGNFLVIFHEYHKNEHAQPQWANLGISYEKYLNLKEFDTTKLEALESEHNRITGLEFKLYETNNLFFTYASNKTRDTSYLEAMKLAPERASYKVFDLLTFSGNKAKVEIPKKPFEVHALNKAQIDLLQDVTDYVNASGKLGLEYRDILKNVEKYVKWENGRSTGLSFDLKQIQFSYNNILNQRL
jgi:hypothetical protein